MGELVVLFAHAILASTLALDGEWNLRYWPQPDDGAVRTLAAVPSDAKRVPATVPGNCELDLVLRSWLHRAKGF